MGLYIGVTGFDPVIVFQFVFCADWFPLLQFVS